MKLDQSMIALHERSSRRKGEAAAKRAAVMLFCIVSMLRTGVTQILPFAGAAAWWVSWASFLPGVITFALLQRMLRCRAAGSLADLARQSAGTAGAYVVSILTGILCLLEGAASFTALVTFFTEGIGTSGTQMTMAILTAGVMMTSLHREGLPRAVWLLRWPMIIAVGLALIASFGAFKADLLYPFMGESRPASVRVLLSNCSAGWPLILLADHGGNRKTGRGAGAVPVFAVSAVLFVICLAIPHERLIGQSNLADALTLPSRYASAGIRTLLQCLTMLLLFLGSALSIHFAASAFTAPMKHKPRFLPAILLVFLVATQGLDIAALWQSLSFTLRHAAIPVAAVLLLCLWGRNRRKA